MSVALSAGLVGAVVAVAASELLPAAGRAPTTARVPIVWTKPAAVCGPAPEFSYPRAAVNLRGQAIVACIGPRDTFQVATADAGGRFDRPHNLGSGSGPSVAISASGARTVVWSGRRELGFARQEPGHGFTPAATLVPPDPQGAGTRIRDTNPRLAAQPDGSTLVVYEHIVEHGYSVDPPQLRSVTISPAGRPGQVTDLGLGGFSAGEAFGSSPDGEAAVCCLASAPIPGKAPAEAREYNILTTYRPGTGWSRVTPPLGANERIESVAAGSGAVALGTTDIDIGGDAGLLGRPILRRLQAEGGFASPRRAPVRVAGRALDPVAAIDGGGRDVLVYQEKRRSQAFDRNAPVYAVAATPEAEFGARRRLDPHDVSGPAVRAFGGGAIVAWESIHRRWGISIERGGTFAPARPPAAARPSSRSQSFSDCDDIATGGRYVVLAWTARDGSTRASLGRL